MKKKREQLLNRPKREGARVTKLTGLAGVRSGRRRRALWPSPVSAPSIVGARRAPYLAVRRLTIAGVRWAPRWARYLRSSSFLGLACSGKFPSANRKPGLQL